MPLIQVKVIENVFTDEQKQEIVRSGWASRTCRGAGASGRPRSPRRRRRCPTWSTT